MFDKALKAFEIPTIDGVREVNQVSFKLGDFNITLNLTTLIMTWITMAILILLAYLGTRRLERFPSRGQSFVELIIDAFDRLIADTMGPVGRRYFSLITTLFFFILISNWLSIIPILKNPTADLNTTLGLGIMVFIIAQGSGVISKGVGGYLKGFFEPLFIAPFAFFINIAGEVGKTLSHSFRLFGNIFGGGLIMLIIFAIPELLQTAWCRLFGEFIGRSLYWGFLWPFCKILATVILNAFFCIFVGSLQAFVFTILAMAYITIARD